MEALVAFLLVAVTVMLEVAVAFLIARFVKRTTSRGYFYSAAIFLGWLWLLMLGTHAALTYIEDAHITHAHDHALLRFANSVYENLQSEVWQIWIAAFTFGTAWLGAKFFWKGTPESQE